MSWYDAVAAALHMLLLLHMLQLQLATYAAVVVMWQAPSVANNEREWERASWKNYSDAAEENVCCQEKCALKLQLRMGRGKGGRGK